MTATSSHAKAVEFPSTLLRRTQCYPTAMSPTVNQDMVSAKIRPHAMAIGFTQEPVAPVNFSGVMISRNS